MMKRCCPFLLAVSFWIPIAVADYTDGYIETGEYEYGVQWYTYNPPLIVEGGGADNIEMWNSGRLEVRNTSYPTNGNWHNGGITNIYLDDYTQLLYLDGWTEEITIEENAAAVLKGGSIDYVTSKQKVGWHGSIYWGDPHIDLYCLSGWEWVYTGEVITGITGIWQDGTDFDIILVNHQNYDPAWTNFNIIVPEPATVVFLCLGGFIVRMHKRTGLFHGKD